MKKVFLIILGVLLCLGSFQVFNNRPQAILTDLHRKELLSSEGTTLRYIVYFMGVIPLVEATISQQEGVAYDGKQAIEMKFLAKPISPFFDFFKGRVELVSLLDAKEMNALKFSEFLHVPGSITEGREVFYDQKNNIIKVKEEERTMLPNTQDPLSMMYFLRHQNFVEGQEVDLNINTNQKDYRFLTKVDEKKVFLINHEEIAAVALGIDIKRRNKSRRNSTKMTVWLTDDKKIPFLIKVFTNGLLIVIRLNSIS